MATVQRRTYKPEEAAKVLGVGLNNLYSMIRDGRLRSLRNGRCILIPTSAVEEFLKGPK